jgi:hypothetical protein
MRNIRAKYLIEFAEMSFTFYGIKIGKDKIGNACASCKILREQIQ